MRAILFMLSLAVLATLAWGGYWFVGARGLDRAVSGVLASNAQLQAQGHRVRGFPNRFDLTIDAPRLNLPALSWQAAFVQIFALSYRPHHVITVFPADQHFRIADIALSLHSQDARASLVMEPGLSLPLERLVLVLKAPEARLEGQTHRAELLRLGSEAITPEHHHFTAQIETVFPDVTLMNALDPGAHWPRRFDVLRIEGEARFERPLDRASLSGGMPALADLMMTGARVIWTEDAVQTDIAAQGRLSTDAQGRLDGEITLDVRNWRALMRRAAAADLMPAEHALLIELALSGMVDPEDPDRLRAPVVVQNGDIMLGPVILGSLPPLF
ncbi:MAG: DUF2125 domain-containing protein [Rhodobacteraceae bacterium]|nr:MAG: DUF2125 domain-containing protein [Paracoccaceae bacterium]